MSRTKFELRRLSYFIAVAENGGFHNASKVLNISQPPLTRQIKLLEEELGVTLLHRTKEGSSLTPAGQQFYSAAKKIVTLSENAVEDARMVALGQLGRLDIGIYGSAVFKTIPKIVQLFRNLYPGVKVSLHNLDRSAQLAAIKEKRLDAGFNWFFPGDAEIERLPFKSEPLVVAVHETHTLSSAKTLSLKQLKDETVILFPRSGHPNFTDHVLHLYRKTGIEPLGVEEVDDVVTAVALVSSGFGITIAAKSASILMAPNVKFIPLELDEADGVTLCLYSRRDDCSGALAAFKRVALKYFDEA